MQIKHKKYFLGIVLLTFLFTVLIRLPNLDRPLSKHHEFNMAMLLNVCASWDLKGGPSAVYFCPVIDYGNMGDVYYGTHEMLKEGKLYYASLGSLQFLLPYYFCKIFPWGFTPLLVQIFSLLVQLFSIILLFHVFIKLLKSFPNHYYLATIGCILYLFLPNVLWFFSNGYVHETLVLPFYWVVLYFLHQSKDITIKLVPMSVFFLGLAIFLGIWADWFMVIVTFTYSGYYLLRAIQTKKRIFLWRVLLLVIPTLLAIASIFYCYTKQLGSNDFFSMFINKFQARSASGVSATMSYSKIFMGIGKNIMASYLPLLIVLVALGILNWKKIDILKQRTLWLLCLPPILYNLIFLEFSAEHDYAFLKFSLVLVYVFCILSSFLPSIYRKVIVSLVIASSIGFYFYINRVGGTAQNGDSYATNKEIGVFIKDNTIANETIFTNLGNDNFQAVMYYAKRNCRFFENEVNARTHVQLFSIANAVFVTGDQNKKLSVTKLN
jgi:hypothetical protein